MADRSDRGYGGGVLLDTSAWARIGLGRLERSDRARFEEAVRADQVFVCPPFALEALRSARDGLAEVLVRRGLFHRDLAERLRRGATATPHRLSAD